MSAQFVAFGLSPALARVITVPQLRHGAVNRATGYIEAAAGKATNAARVARELGAHATVVTPAGDEDAARFQALCEADGIVCRAVPYPGRVRWAYTLVDDEAATELVVNEPNPVPATLADSVLAELKGAVTPQSVCVMAGSRLEALPRSLLVEGACAMFRRAATLVLDIRGADLRAALDALRELRGGAFVAVKINAEELLDTMESAAPATDESALRAATIAFAGAYGVTTVVTRGPDAVLFACSHGAHGEVAVPEVRSRNPIGSGDTFLAAFALALHVERMDGVGVDGAVRRAVQHAIGAAAKNATFLKPGTIIGP